MHLPCRPIGTPLALCLWIATAACTGDDARGRSAADASKVVDAGDGTTAAPCPGDTESVQRNILVPRCGGCHAGDEPAQGLDLASPELEARLSGAQGVCGRVVIAPGDPASSYLLAKVTLPELSCGEPMPLDGEPLPLREVECLEEWIASLPPRAVPEADGGEPPDPPGEGGTPDGAPSSLCPADKMECGGQCITPIEPTFESLHERVLARSCVFNSCHGSADPREELDLSTLDGAHAAIVGVPSRQRPELALVEPGSPGESYLVHKLRDLDLPPTDSTGTSTSERMPLPPNPPLCEEKIRLVEEWISAGAVR